MPILAGLPDAVQPDGGVKVPYGCGYRLCTSKVLAPHVRPELEGWIVNEVGQTIAPFPRSDAVPESTMLAGALIVKDEEPNETSVLK